MNNTIRKKSFIIKLFIKISSVLALITLIIGFSIYQYSHSIMMSEIEKFSQAALKQVGDDIGNVVMDAVYLSERIAYNSELINQLKDKENVQSKEKINEIVENIIEDYMWLKNQHHKRLYEVYIVNAEEVVYTSDPTNDVSTISEEFCLNAPEDLIISDRIENPEAKGIYRYGFGVNKAITDHLTGEQLGYITLKGN